MNPLPISIYSLPQIQYYFSDQDRLRPEISKIQEFLDPGLKEDQLLDQYRKYLVLDKTRGQISFDLSKIPELARFRQEPLRLCLLLRLQWYKTQGWIPDLRVTCSKYQSMESIPFKDLGSRVHTHVLVKGMVRRTGSTMTALVSSQYLCRNCGGRSLVHRAWYQKIKPHVCMCGGRGDSLVQVLDKRRFENWQTLVLQGLGDSQSSHHLTVRILDSSGFDAYLPGEQVLVHGILDLELKDNTTSNLFLDGFQVIQPLKKKTRTSSRDINLYHAFVRETQDYWEALKRQIFPHIFGLDSCKDGVILQLFGGNQGSTRSNIHILMVGNPSSGKSALMRAVQSLVGGVNVTGSGATSAGLTATAYKDQFGGWCLDGGSLVMSSSKIVYFDQLDKLSKVGQQALLQAMEQQTISVSKAGINVTLPAKCRILAASNPKLGSRFNPDQSYLDQLGLSAPLLSRFDLILVLDSNQRKGYQKTLISRVIDSKVGVVQESYPPTLGENVLGYLSYARTLAPIIGSELRIKIGEFYQQVRKKYQALHTMPLEVRQLEGLIRLAQAKCKSRLGTQVSLEDWTFVRELVRKTYSTLANQQPQDPLMGQLRTLMDVTISRRDQQVIKIIKDNLKNQKLTSDRCFLVITTQDPSITRKLFDKALRILMEAGIIYKPDGYNLALVRNV